MISKQALTEFKELWEKENGEPLSDELALDEAVNLLTFFNAIYRPIKTEWFSEVAKNNYDNGINGGKPQKESAAENK